MRYALWSRGRLVGHTDLDIHTITPTMRQGFVEPTDEGQALLADATGVWRAIAEVKRASRARGESRPTDHSLVEAAAERREALDLELRDESGAVFPCDYIRITDLFDLNNGIVDEMCDTEEEDEAAFQIHLSKLSGEAREKALADRAALYAAIEHDAEIIREKLEEAEEERERGWPPAPPEDPRWDTMQYLLQAHMAEAPWIADSHDLPM